MNQIVDIPWEALDRCVAGTLGSWGAFVLEPMPGGASTRRFIRLKFASGQSAVAMFFPEAMRSDELAKPLEFGTRWPFLQVHDLLSERHIAVPRVLAHDPDNGLLIVEDLGDDTLARYIEKNPETRLALYQQAVRDLARAQIALEPLPEGCIVTIRRFDFDLLRWEIDHFREWALEAQGIHLSQAEAGLFDEAASYLARQAANWSRVFVHRDYQSRNLMVRSAEQDRLELVWIDFQDALLGPRVYDLVALLNDSYQAFAPDFINARLREYLSERSLPDSDFDQLRFEFDWVTVQRKLKDAGRFVFIDRAKGNSSFLQFVVPTITKVRLALANLRADPLLSRLDDCFATWFHQIVSRQPKV